MSIFLDDKDFQADRSWKVLKFIKSGIVNGEMTVQFNLEPGTYGFALVDDENNNSDMDYSFFGMPDEGFGFSNYYLTGLKRPNFEMFKFVLNKEQKQKVSMKIRYM